MSIQKPVEKQIRSGSSIEFNFVKILIKSVKNGIVTIHFQKSDRDEIHRLAAEENVAIPHMGIYLSVTSLKSGGYVDVKFRHFELSDIEGVASIQRRMEKLELDLTASQSRERNLQRQLQDLNEKLKSELARIDALTVGQNELRSEKDDLLKQIESLEHDKSSLEVELDKMPSKTKKPKQKKKKKKKPKKE